ncbi:MAG: efflux RND transporter periplasmic adaptor subunit [Gammaproteobacteria bacterium]|nr:efflux RND transporter periplasmic adaptor subunit [Gammaproteobacteria bacterium]
MKKVLIVLLGAGALAALAWHLTRPEPIAVRLAEVGRGEVRATVANTRVGTVEACRRARMSPAAAGQVAALEVVEGQNVAADQLLLEIWNRDLAAQLELAESEAGQAHAQAREACALAQGARREADRQAKLRRNKLVAEEVADDAQTRAESSQAACEAALAATRVSAARIAVARESLERTRLRAPFDGVVAELDVKLGEFLTPSPPGIATVPAVDLIDPDCIYVSAPIDEVDAPRIVTGMSACVTLDAFPDRVCDASVRRIANYVLDREKQARTVEVEVAFGPAVDTARFLPGYSADIEVLIESRGDVLRVPSEAVIEGDHVLVYDAASGLLARRAVTTGLANWEYTEITDGLAAGEQVVLSTGRAGVVDGASVTPEAAP